MGARDQQELPTDLPQVPEGWHYLCLREMVDPDRGISYGIVQPGQDTPTGVPVLRVNNLKNGRIDTADVMRVEPSVEADYARTRLRGSEVLLTLVGTLGQVATATPEMRGWNVARAVGVVPVKDAFGPRWVALCLRSPLAQRFIRTWATTTVQATLNLGDVARLPIPVPPRPERDAIAHILGTLDDKIELNRRMNETLEALARAIFKSWFVDFDPVHAKMAGRQPVGMDAETAALFPDRMQESEIGEIPAGWRVSSLGEVADVIDCLHARKPDRIKGGRLFLQLANIRDDGLLDPSDAYLISDEDYAKWVSRMEARKGDCVITNVGRVGAVAQVPPGIEAALGRNMTGIRPREPFNSPTFLIECLLSEEMRQEILRRVDTGTILDALNVRNIPRLRFVRPDDHVLDRFETTARPLRARMEHSLEESRTLASIRDTLLPKLLSGELRIPDVEKLVEAAT